MAVPYTFGSATSSIPLSQLDSNFATGITLGNTTVYLGNTTTSFGNVSLTNVTISSVSTAITPAQGGTGLITIPANNVILGNGTSNVTVVAPGTSGNVLTSTGTTWASTALSAASVPAAGSTTQVQYNNAGAFAGSANLTFNGTTLTAAGLSGPHNGTVGATTPSTGAFTTLAASSTVSGTGFSTYLASPPAIGGTAPAAGAFTTLTASTPIGTASGGTGLGGATPFTSGGVVYASSSSALATGSALTFDGTNFVVNNGYIRANNTLGYYTTLTATGLTNFATTMDFNSVASHIFSINSSEIFRTTSSSLYTASGINVGFGTSSPSALAANYTTVDIRGTTGGALRFGNATDSAYIYSDSNETNIATATNKRMIFSINTAEKMRLDTSGNLGLGVTPSASWSSLVTQQIGTGGNLFAFKSGNVDKFFMNSNTYYDGSNYIYQSTGFATQYVMDSGVHRWSSAPSGTAAGVVTFTDVLSVDRGKSLALQGASSQTGTGITFPATQSASSNANTLDDYEEGTWTPTVSGGYTGVTYTIQNGRYTKIGRVVTLTCYLQFSGTFDASQINVSGLPFDLAVAQGGNAGTVGYWDVTTDGNLSAWIAGSTNVIFYKIGTSSAAISIGNVSGKFIIFSITGSI